MNKKLMAVPMILALLSMSVGVMADAVSVTTDVDKYMTATFYYSAVAYGSQSAGASDVAATGQGSAPGYNVSVSTNYPYKVSALGTNFDDGAGHTFAISNLKMDSDWSAGSLAVGNAVALSTGSQDIDNNIGEGNTTSYHGFWLSVPAAQYAASYTSTLTVTVTNEA